MARSMAYVANPKSISIRSFKRQPKIFNMNLVKNKIELFDQFIEPTLNSNVVNISAQDL